MPPANVDLPHQGIDARFVVLLAVFSEAGVTEGGEDGAVTEDFLNVEEVDSGFD